MLASSPLFPGGRGHRAARVLARVLVVWTTVTLLVVAGLALLTPTAGAAAVDCSQGTTINNGRILLGVNCVGDLGTSGRDGLRYMANGHDAVSQGCSCEGWGVLDTFTGVKGYANESPIDDKTPGTSDNLTVKSFTADARTATSVVDVGSTYRVIQDYHPSLASPDLYEVTVTVSNISTQVTHLQYRRVMDWDVQPTAQQEFVTLQQGNAPTIRYTSDDGFATSDPSADPTKIFASGSFEDSGPFDHGALFDFDFGFLGPKGSATSSKTFQIYYGATDNEKHAIDALNAINAEAFSLGEPSSDGGEVDGVPNTFIFGFKDIGGDAIFAPYAVTDQVDAYTGEATTVSVLDNDHDPNGDPLTITGATAPEHGTASCTTTTCTYTSAAGYTGPDAFTYSISDGNGGAARATVSLSVALRPANHPPVAVTDTITTDEDVSGSVDVVANDTDEDTADQLTVTGHGAAAHGTVTCGTRTCSYAPAADWNGTDSFTYTLSDGHTTTTGTVNVTVAAVNDAPVARDDVGSDGSGVATDEDKAVVVPVTANDTDVEGSTLSAALLAAPAHGSVTCSGGSCTYTPAPNYNGTDSFTYRAYDGAAWSAPATVKIKVAPVNDAPVANRDTLALDQDTSAGVPVLANDIDVDGDALTVSTHGAAAHGTVTCSATACTYTPTAGYRGPDSFTYTVSDGTTIAVGTVDVTVRAVNHAPVARADSLTLDEDSSGPVDLLANDTDPDGDPVTVASHTDPAHGTLSCTGGRCTYTPAADFHGTDSFSYVATDGSLSSTGTVAITVASVNDAPRAVADSATVQQDTTRSISVLANDTDVDGDTLTVSAHTDPAHGTVTCSTTACSYTPTAGYTGPDSFGYTVSDGTTTASATVAITVTKVNHAPKAVTDLFDLDEDTSRTVDLLANDTDADGDTLTVTSHTNPAHGTLACTGSTCTYTPAANYHGTDSFSYVVTDGALSATGTAVVNVASVNDAPVARDDAASTDEDTAVGVSVLANDLDADADALSVAAHTDPAHGTVSCTATACTYTPAANYHGTDSFGYTVSDGTTTATATVRLTVRPVNDAPVAVDDSAVTDEDTVAVVPVTANDVDVDGDTLVATKVAGPTHGTATCSAGSCTYTPAANYHGTDSFTYRVSDGTLTSGTATVRLSVTSVNDAPVAVGDTLVVDEDTTGQVQPLANDTDADADPLTLAGTTQPDHGSVACTATTCTYTPAADYAGSDAFGYTVSDGTTTAQGTVAVTVRPVDDAPVADDDTATTDEDTPVDIAVTDGDTDVDDPVSALSGVLVTPAAHGNVSCSGAVCRYTPAADWNGTDTFTYRASDGRKVSAPATVSVVVRPVNDAPRVTADTASTGQDQAVDVDVLANDSDVEGDTLSIVTPTQPAHGSVTCDTVCHYTPASGYSGTDAFTYTADDGHGGRTTGTVSVTVDLPNRAPTAGTDRLTTAEDRAATVAVLANDTDPDAGDRLSVTHVDTSALGVHVTCTAAGTCSYLPPADVSGPDSFTYTVSDAGGLTATGRVEVSITPVNDAPSPASDSLTLDRDTVRSVSVLVNDDDVDGDALTVTATTKPAHATVTCTAAGVCTVTPERHWAGSTSFRYTVSDGNGGTAQGTVSVTVRPVTSVSDAPVIGTPATGSWSKGKYNAKATWKTPAWNGGTAITGYRVTAQRYSGSKVVWSKTFTVKAGSTSLLMKLAKGTYRYRVVAVNKIGTSAASALSRTSTVR